MADIIVADRLTHAAVTQETFFSSSAVPVLNRSISAMDLGYDMLRNECYETENQKENIIHLFLIEGENYC